MIEKEDLEWSKEFIETLLRSLDERVDRLTDAYATTTANLIHRLELLEAQIPKK